MGGWVVFGEVIGKVEETPIPVDTEVVEIGPVLEPEVTHGHRRLVRAQQAPMFQFCALGAIYHEISFTMSAYEDEDSDEEPVDKSVSSKDLLRFFSPSSRVLLSFFSLISEIL
jgi:hypothetical protein